VAGTVVAAVDGRDVAPGEVEAVDGVAKGVVVAVVGVVGVVEPVEPLVATGAALVAVAASSLVSSAESSLHAEAEAITIARRTGAALMPGLGSDPPAPR
jgi:hypothetical protein